MRIDDVPRAFSLVGEHELTEDPLEHATMNCPSCLEAMEPTDHGWLCRRCRKD